MTRLRKAGFALVMLGVALGGAEIGARPFAPPYDRTLPLPSPGRLADPVREQFDAARAAHAQDFALYARKDFGWALPPATEERVGDITYRYNSLGFRGPELAPLTDGEVRLFSVGDSSTFGHGVSEAYIYTRVAATRLSSEWGRAVTTFHGAVPGHDTSRSRAVLARLGPEVEPGWVIVGNLWSDVIATADPMEQSALRKSALVRLLEEQLSPWMRQREVTWLHGRDDVGTPESVHRVSIEDYGANLRKLAENAKALGARAAFVMLPAPLDLERMPVPESVQQYRDTMRDIATEAGAPLVDGPAILHAEGGDLSWFLDQVHPSELGHAKLGEALAAALAATPPPAGAHRYAEMDRAVLPRPEGPPDSAVNAAGPQAVRNLPDGTQVPFERPNQRGPLPPGGGKLPPLKPAGTP